MLDSFVTTLVEGMLFGVAAATHCSLMCGPVAIAAANVQSKGQARLPLYAEGPAVGGILSYQASRVLSYTIIGALAGGLGESMASLFPGEMRRYVLVAAGVLMLLSGSTVSRAVARLRLLTVARHWLSRTLTPTSRGMGLGLLTPLIPCGVSLAAIPFAAATAHIGLGAIFFAGFASISGLALLATQLLSVRIGGLFSARLRVLATFACAGVLFAHAFFIPFGNSQPTQAAPACHHHTK